MKIKKTILPENSLLSKTRFHYADCYSCNFNDPDNKITIIDIGKSFFTSGPKWIDQLFHFRNFIVKHLGLKVSGIDTNELHKKLMQFDAKVGDQIGLFKVYEKNDCELILGEDDKHLNFRISLFLNKSSTSAELCISTIVYFNNRFGRLYFLPVKPFHKIVVPTMLKGIVKNCNQLN